MEPDPPERPDLHTCVISYHNIIMCLSFLLTYISYFYLLILYFCLFFKIMLMMAILLFTYRYFTNDCIE